MGTRVIAVGLGGLVATAFMHLSLTDRLLIYTATVIGFGIVLVRVAFPTLHANDVQHVLDTLIVYTLTFVAGMVASRQEVVTDRNKLAVLIACGMIALMGMVIETTARCLARPASPVLPKTRQDVDDDDPPPVRKPPPPSMHRRRPKSRTPPADSSNDEDLASPAARASPPPSPRPSKACFM